MAESSGSYRRCCQLVRSQLRRRLFVWSSLWSLVFWAFLVGTLFFAGRFYWGSVSNWTCLTWAISVLAPCLAAAWILAIRKTPSESSVRSVLDRRFDCGGILVSGLECSTEAWESPAMSNRLLAEGRNLFRLDWRRPLVLLGLGGLFLLFVGVVPIVRSTAETVHPLDLSQDTQRISRKVEVLAQQEAISELQAREWLEQLQKIAQQSGGTGPAEAFEALDGLEKRIDQKAADQGEKLGGQAQALDQAQALSDALKNQAENSAELNQAMENLLKENLDKLGAPNWSKENNGASDGNGGEGANSGNGESDESPFDQESPLSQEQLEKIQDWLNQQEQKIAGNWDDLKDLSIDELQDCDCPLGDCELNPEDLKELELLEGEFELGDCEGGDCEEGLRLLLAKRLANKPGRGGIMRGRGDAPLTLNPNEPTESSGELKKERLDSQLSRQAIQESRLRGVSRANPGQSGGEENDAQGSVLQNEGGKDGTGNAPLIYPEHRRVVEEYFR